MARAGAILMNLSWDDKVGFLGKRVHGHYRGPGVIASEVDLNLTSAVDSGA